MSVSVFDPVDDDDRRLVAGATGLLGEANRAGLLEAPDVHVALRLGVLGGESDPAVLLAVALTVRAVRLGSVCVDLSDAADGLLPAVGPTAAGPWPDPAAWTAAVAASPLVEAGAVHLEGSLVYLDRYHRLEQEVCEDLRGRLAAPPPEADTAWVEGTLARWAGPRLADEQAAALGAAVRQRTTVLTGGPGTGKTTTVARLLALLAGLPGASRLSVALSAPTGKAAARLQEAVETELARLPAADQQQVARMLGRVEARTLHRLLGWRPDNLTRFRSHRGNRLGHDLVVVDECSMVDLTMMARLLEAVRPDTRLVLLGDPGQLTSIGAGAVLADIVAGFDGDPASPVVSLVVNHRSTGRIRTLAEALRRADADAVVAALRDGAPEVEWFEGEEPADVLRADLLDAALAVRAAAESGDAAGAVAALDEHRLLCPHREGSHGVRRWNRLVEQWLGEATGQEFWSQWYVGRPLLVTANDYTLETYNGETGAVVRAPDGRLRAWISGAGGLKEFAPGRLDAVETMHAMTVHKSQGSQARRITMLLPDEESRLLTRELFYTAVTRAQERLRVVGSEAAVRSAVDRTAQRATGLARRLHDTRA